MHERHSYRPGGRRGHPGPLNRGLSGTGRVGDDLYLAAHDDRSGKPQLPKRQLGLGFAAGEPVTHGTCQCFSGGLRSAQAEMDLLRCGALAWEYIPIPQGSITPPQAARIVLTPLMPGPVPASLPPAPDPGLPPKDAAAQMLAAREMMARPAAIRYPYPDTGQAPEVHTEVMVRILARRARGYARITDEGTIRWQCQFAAPGNPASGLAPPEVAQVIAAALAEHRTAGHGDAQSRAATPGGAARRNGPDGGSP